MVVIRYYYSTRTSSRAYIGELIAVDGELLTFEGYQPGYHWQRRIKTYRRDIFDGFPFYGQYLIAQCDYEKI